MIRPDPMGELDTFGSPRARRIVFAAAAAMFAVQVALFRGVRLDDAFITFRYAQNLATGVGFVLNRGERVMGSTSPGEVLLATVAHFVLGHDAMPSAMAALGCAGWTAQAIAFFSLLRKSFGDFRAAWLASRSVSALRDRRSGSRWRRTSHSRQPS